MRVGKSCRRLLLVFLLAQTALFQTPMGRKTALWEVLA